MRTIVIAALTLFALCGCSSVSNQPMLAATNDNRQVFIFTRNAADGSQTIRDMELHCADGGGSHTNKDEYVSCKEIPVVVLSAKDESGNEICRTFMPYNVLVVHTRMDKDDVEVRWNLVASKKRYRFKTAAGVDLKFTAQTPGGALVDPKHYYSDFGASGSGGGASDRYTWRFNKRAQQDKKRFNHEAVVEKIDNDGKVIAECEPLDPVITNSD